MKNFVNNSYIPTFHLLINVINIIHEGVLEQREIIETNYIS